MGKDQDTSDLPGREVGSPSAVGDEGPLELEEHLRWLKETIPGFSYRCLPGPASTMLRLTQGIETLSGYSADEFLQGGGRTYASIIHPEDRASVAQAILRAIASEAPHYLEYRIVHRDGSTRWVVERGRGTFESGKLKWLDGHVVDQTEVRVMRLQAEQRKEAVRKQQAALVSLVTSDAIASGDLEEASEIASKLVAESVGVERVSVWLLDASGATLEQVSLFQASDRSHQGGARLGAADYPSYFNALHTGRLIDAREAQVDPRTCEFRDGYLQPLGIASMLDVALRVSGRVAGVLCLEHVGKPRTWSDHEIQFAAEVADQLAHVLLNKERLRAQEREAQLQEQLFFSQKMEAIGQLASSVAHDFNNLLTVISGFAEELQESLSDEAALGDVGEIVKAAQQGTELTAQLLSMSRREPIELKRVDLVEAMQELSKMIPKMLSQDVTLSVDVPKEPVPVLTSLGLTQQILTNLIVNAGRAMDDRGTIAVTIRTVEETAPFAVEQGELPAGNYALLEVADSGKGMTEEVRARIFDPFFTTRPQGTGTGLGLSTVFDIVRRCSGGIHVSSSLGAGSIFSVYLPLLEDAARHSVQPSVESILEKDDAWALGLHIIVVEDNDAVLNVMQNALVRLGAQVTTATRPEEAIGVLEGWAERNNSEPDLILTDMGMPGGGGSRVIQWVKEHRPDVPIAVVSGYIPDNQTDAVEGLELLRKPFLSADLQNFVREVFLQRGAD